MVEEAAAEEADDARDALLADERDERDDRTEERAERGDASALRGVVSGGSTREDDDASVPVAWSPLAPSVVAFGESMLQ